MHSHSISIFSVCTVKLLGRLERGVTVGLLKRIKITTQLHRCSCRYLEDRSPITQVCGLDGPSSWGAFSAAFILGFSLRGVWGEHVEACSTLCLWTSSFIVHAPAFSSAGLKQPAPAFCRLLAFWPERVSSPWKSRRWVLTLQRSFVAHFLTHDPGPPLPVPLTALHSLNGPPFSPPPPLVPRLRLGQSCLHGPPYSRRASRRAAWVLCALSMNSSRRKGIPHSGAPGVLVNVFQYIFLLIP